MPIITCACGAVDTRTPPACRCGCGGGCAGTVAPPLTATGAPNEAKEPNESSKPNEPNAPGGAVDGDAAAAMAASSATCGSGANDTRGPPRAAFAGSHAPAVAPPPPVAPPSGAPRGAAAAVAPPLGRKVASDVDRSADSGEFWPRLPSEAGVRVRATAWLLPPSACDMSTLAALADACMRSPPPGAVAVAAAGTAAAAAADSGCAGAVSESEARLPKETTRWALRELPLLCSATVAVSTGSVPPPRTPLAVAPAPVPSVSSDSVAPPRDPNRTRLLPLPPPLPVLPVPSAPAKPPRGDAGMASDAAAVGLTGALPSGRDREPWLRV